MRISLVAEPQYDSLVDLLCELHSYYNEDSSVPHDLVRAYLVDHLLSPGSPLRLVVATQEGDLVVGLSAISLTYSLVDPTLDNGRQCWLKELYVSSTRRSRGVGASLTSWVARYALEHGCSRIDWPVKASNDRGITFYENLGAAKVADRLSYRLSSSALHALASKPA